jgi:hypothetical protein
VLHLTLGDLYLAELLVPGWGVVVAVAVTVAVTVAAGAGTTEHCLSILSRLVVSSSRLVSSSVQSVVDVSYPLSPSISLLYNQSLTHCLTHSLTLTHSLSLSLSSSPPSPPQFQLFSYFHYLTCSTCSSFLFIFLSSTLSSSSTTATTTTTTTAHSLPAPFLFQSSLHRNTFALLTVVLFVNTVYSSVEYSTHLHSAKIQTSLPPRLSRRDLIPRLSLSLSLSFAHSPCSCPATLGQSTLLWGGHLAVDSLAFEHESSSV